MTGIELIAKERQEQIEKHGRTIEKDEKENTSCELSNVASFLAVNEHYRGCNDVDDIVDMMPEKWNKTICLKMMNKSYRERLIIAGALIAAEIDRLQLE